MSFQDFLLLHSEKASKSSLFKDSEFLEHDKPVTALAIEEVEREYNVSLPTNYKEFCKQFGGGDFGRICVYSLDKAGDWFIFDKLDELVSYGYNLSSKFLPFTDDGTGGLYCFVRRGVTVEDEIVFIDEMNQIEQLPFSSFVNCVLERAYI